MLAILNLLYTFCYTTSFRRSIYITTPWAYRGTISPTYNKEFVPIESKEFNPILKENNESIAKESLEPSGFKKAKESLYDALFGGGFMRLVVYLIVAILFLIIGYQVRKQEEYGSYVRLPTTEA